MMIILPIGHEEKKVQRLPWITFGIMGLCTLALLLTSQVEVEDPDEQLPDILHFYMTRNYLEPDPELKQELDDKGGAFFRQYQELFGAEQASENIPDQEIVDEEQAELDKMTEKWLEARGKLMAHPLMAGGFVPAHFSAFRLISSMFLHAGWLHLLGNMLFFFLTAPFLEDKWGRPLFTGFYLASGIIAALGFAAQYPHSEIPLVGASGAIAGLMGAFLVRFWNTNIKFVYFFWVGRIGGGTFEAPAWLMLPLWVLGELWNAFLMDALTDGEGGGVAYWAHVWGFVGGVGLALAIRHWKVEEKYILPAIEEKLGIAENPAIVRAAEVREEGRVDEAVDILAAEIKGAPFNPAVVMAYWDAALSAGRTEEAGPEMLKMIRHKLGANDVELALEAWSELHEKTAEMKLDMALAFKLIDAYVARQREVEAGWVIERLALAGATTRGPIGLRLKLARTAAKIGSSRAPEILESLLAEKELPEPSRRELTALLEKAAAEAKKVAKAATSSAPGVVQPDAVSGPVPVGAAVPSAAPAPKPAPPPPVLGAPFVAAVAPTFEAAPSLSLDLEGIELPDISAPEPAPPPASVRAPARPAPVQAPARPAPPRVESFDEPILAELEDDFMEPQQQFFDGPLLLEDEPDPPRFQAPPLVASADPFFQEWQKTMGSSPSPPEDDLFIDELE